MNPFPEDYELISLFESEPQLADPKVPWAYNRLEFSLTRSNGTLSCVIEPGYEALVLDWMRDGEMVVHLDLRWVLGLEVRSGGGRESLVATMRDTHLKQLHVQTSPKLAVSWGTTGDCPSTG